MAEIVGQQPIMNSTQGLEGLRQIPDKEIYIPPLKGGQELAKRREQQEDRLCISSKYS